MAPDHRQMRGRMRDERGHDLHVRRDAASIASYPQWGIAGVVTITVLLT
jgi:hypothetical protein